MRFGGGYYASRFGVCQQKNPLKKISSGDLVVLFGEMPLLPYQEYGVAEDELSTFPEASEDGVVYKIDHLSSSLRLCTNHERLTHLGFDFVTNIPSSICIVGSNNPGIGASVEEGKSDGVILKGVVFSSGAVAKRMRFVHFDFIDGSCCTSRYFQALALGVGFQALLLG